MTLRMSVAYQEWPYRQTFTFARESREAAPLFVVHITDGSLVGRGECGIQSLKDETPEIVLAQLHAMRDRIAELGSRAALNEAVAAQSSRNAVDCALWDLECKRAGASIWSLTGVSQPESIEVDITIGINSLEKMRADAQAAAQSVHEKVTAIAAAVPDVAFIVDANEAWSLGQLKDLAPALKTLNVILIEQPLHHDKDAPLADYDCPIPLCADESCATASQIDMLAERYDAVNIKLDKTGGLTEALALAKAARAKDMGLMMGCNGATSLGNAPAYVVGSLCDWRDIDSQELLFEDRAGGMRTREGRLHAFDTVFWG
jgi:L-Ala-D/L-Glu epimerase